MVCDDMILLRLYLFIYCFVLHVFSTFTLVVRVGLHRCFHCCYSGYRWNYFYSSLPLFPLVLLLLSLINPCHQGMFTWTIVYPSELTQTSPLCLSSRFWSYPQIDCFLNHPIVNLFTTPTSMLNLHKTNPKQANIQT